MSTTKSQRLVSLEALLPTESGRSLATEKGPITAKNVASFLPTAETIAAATRALQAEGFKVSPSETTITFTGSPELFERVFSVTLELKELEAGAVQVILHKPKGFKMPEKLKGLVEDIVAPEPPEYFG